jgi:hypothetical protein
MHVTKQPSRHSQKLGRNIQQFRRQQNKMIDIEPAAKNNGVDMFEQAGIAAE